MRPGKLESRYRRYLLRHACARESIPHTTPILYRLHAAVDAYAITDMYRSLERRKRALAHVYRDDTIDVITLAFHFWAICHSFLDIHFFAMPPRWLPRLRYFHLMSNAMPMPSPLHVPRRGRRLTALFLADARHRIMMLRGDGSRISTPMMVMSF